MKKAYQNRWGEAGVSESGQFQSRNEERKQHRFNNIITDPSRDSSLKKVMGHVNDEDLWNLQKCLVGETTSVCSVKSNADRLEAWGLNGISVQRMGGKSFLLSFEDEDLFIMLEDLEWAYLKEIFCKVVVWSEKLRTPFRETWIEVRGLPLHAWNGTTLKRIAELWGEFEACGENVNRRIDSEKTTFFITTNHPEKIDEKIIVDVGSESHVIHILELGFKDATIDPLNQVTLKKTPTNSVPYQSEDSSECSSSKERKGDDVERTSLIAKEVDKDVGGSIEQEACVLKIQENEKATSEHEGMEKTVNLDGITKKGFEAEEHDF
ncbi:hypothetical protein V6N13_090657 [Hibiscus sabdariffa]